MAKKHGFVIWMTGLSASGKSTLSEVLAERLSDDRVVKKLDGDVLRAILTSRLGFSKEDRDENVRVISYVANLAADCRAVAIVAMISPYSEARQKARELIGSDRFFEVHVDCPLDVLIVRDPKGLYKKALAGKITNFTGISDPYEPPENPECYVSTGDMNDNVCGTVDVILASLDSWLNR